MMQPSYPEDLFEKPISGDTEKDIEISVRRTRAFLDNIGSFYVATGGLAALSVTLIAASPAGAPQLGFLTTIFALSMFEFYFLLTLSTIISSIGAKAAESSFVEWAVTVFTMIFGMTGALFVGLMFSFYSPSSGPGVEQPIEIIFYFSPPEPPALP